MIITRSPLRISLAVAGRIYRLTTVTMADLSYPPQSINTFILLSIRPLSKT